MTSKRKHVGQLFISRHNWLQQVPWNEFLRGLSVSMRVCQFQCGSVFKRVWSIFNAWLSVYMRGCPFLCGFGAVSTLVLSISARVCKFHRGIIVVFTVVCCNFYASLPGFMINRNLFNVIQRLKHIFLSEHTECCKTVPIRMLEWKPFVWNY